MSNNLIESYGKFNAYTTTFVSVIIGIILIAIGIYLIYQSTKTTKRLKLSGKIIEKNCYETRLNKKTYVTKCDLNISYEYNGQTFTGKLFEQNIPTNDNVDIFIDPKSPEIIYSDDGINYWLGTGLIIAGIVMMICCIASSYMVSKNPVAARVSGYAGIFNMIN